jgi:two-component system, NarL family, response regulator NreC
MLQFLRLTYVPQPEPLVRGSDSEHASRSETIRTILADDHAAMRQGLRVLLDSENDIRVVAETDTLAAAIERVREDRPDVLVLDLGMPMVGSGIETLSRVSRQARGTNIVVLTRNDDPGFATRALANGALGLVLKELSDSDLPAAVREASRGRRYVSPRLAARLNGDVMGAGEDKLTPREREVLRLIALGHTSVEIARRLGLSPRTIETHRARIHRKLELETRAELVRYAMRHDLVQV